MKVPVALRKESVDRKIRPMPLIRFCPGSLSARRAWIEKAVWAVEHAYQLSLSARRAWIEKQTLSGLCILHHVALRKESVDRKPDVDIIKQENSGRSPQGERG